jgi:hypothetical protein
VTGSPYKPKVAVIGTEHSGKTVLITVLAAKYSNPAKGFHLNPQNKATYEYIERGFALLNGANGPPQWLPGTDPGTMTKLSWELMAPGHHPLGVRIIDGAGQDFREVFGNDDDFATLPEPTKVLLKHVRRAEILVLTLDLDDFIDRKKDDRRRSSEWTLRGAFDRLAGKSRDKHIALVFTGVDRYRAELEKHGSWKAVAAAHVPPLRAALDDPRLTVMGVAAVAETQLDPSGQSQYVPKPEFKSEGLEDLLGWIVAAAKLVKPPVKPQPPTGALPVSPRPGAPAGPSFAVKLAKTIGGGFFSFFLTVGIAGKTGLPIVSEKKPVYRTETKTIVGVPYGTRQVLDHHQNVPTAACYCVATIIAAGVALAAYNSDETVAEG